MPRRRAARIAGGRSRRACGGDGRSWPLVSDGVVADLAEFDERITDRDWAFDEEESNDDYAVWFFEPSGAEVDDGLPVTSLRLEATEGRAIVRVVLVGTTIQYPLHHTQLFESIWISSSLPER